MGTEFQDSQEHQSRDREKSLPYRETQKMDRALKILRGIANKNYCEGICTRQNFIELNWLRFALHKLFSNDFHYCTTQFYKGQMSYFLKQCTDGDLPNMNFVVQISSRIFK